MEAALPREVTTLFWDVDAESVDLRRHADYVIERVMVRGGWLAMQWLRRAYTPAALADFVQRRGHLLAPRERAYWALVSGTSIPGEPGGGSPPWASP